VRSDARLAEYEIVVRGVFGELLTSAFGDVAATVEDGDTVLVARIRDQADLFGLLDRVRDLGLHVVRVNELRAAT
jgi:hypothetical protein